MKLQVLLVEDNPADAALITEFISDKEGAPSVHWVKNGGHAIDFVYQQGLFASAAAPHLILLDLALPYMDGVAVLKELKMHPSYSGIPVIVLTTSDSEVDRDNCLKLGASAYFSKPVNLQGYEELVQNLLGFEFPRLTSAYRNDALRH